MKMRFKLSLWLITIMAVVVTIVTIVLVRQASGISYYLSVRSLKHLTCQRVEFWKGREEGYIRTLHTLANIMGDYESISAEERRDRYDDMLRSTLEAEPQMAAIYTVWKPNAIDDMDSRYIGRTGSSPAGQYAMAYFKETDNIEGRTSGEIENIIKYITSPIGNKDRVDNPSLYNINGKNTYIIKIAVPVINHKKNKIVGALGCYLSIDAIQRILENTMKTNHEIAIMAMYSGNGTILAHFMPERIGKRMLDVDVELNGSAEDMFKAMHNGRTYMDTVYQPELKENVIFIMKPFQIGNSSHNWSMLIGVPESFILKEVKAAIRFTITLIIIAFSLTSLIVFAIIGIITKPIVNVTEMLKDISEGKGDLTRLLPEKRNDEITDMSHFFNLTFKKIKNFIIIIKQQAAIMSDTGGELSCNMSQTAEAITQITDSLENIKSKLNEQPLSASQTAANDEFVMEINRIAAGADQIKTAVKRTNEINSKNKENIDLLIHGVSVFKVA